MLSNIEIAQQAKLKPIVGLAKDRLGIPEQHLEPYGRTKAKISLAYLDSLRDRPDGKLVLVTAISPTPAGEGKTTTTVGLGDALNRIGKKTVERLLVELKDRAAVVGAGPAAGASSRGGGVGAQAVSALVNLGYKPAEAERLVRLAGADGKTTEQLIRDALKGASR